MSGVKKNFIYNTAYQILVILLPLVTTPYISRTLGATGIGVYSYHFSIARYFVVFAMLGLNNYGNRTIAAVRDNREVLSSTFSEIWFMQLFTAGTSFLVYCFYSLVFAKDLMSVILLAYVLSSVIDINWFFFGIEKFKLTVIRNTVIKLTSVACIFLFVKSPKDVYVYGVILAGSFILSQVAIWPFVHKFVDLKRPNLEDVLKHFKPNLILFVPVIAVSLYKTMDKIMLGILATMNSVGYYQNSENVINIPIALVQSLGTVMLPKMSNLAAKKEIDESLRYIKLSTIFAVFLSSSVSFGIMAVCREFVPWFFGSGFEECVDIFLILAPSCIFMAIANVIRTQYLIPQHMDKPYIISVFIGAIVNLIANYLLIPIMDASGAAVGTLLAEGVVCIYQIFAVIKSFDILAYLKRSAPFFVSGIIMFGIVFPLNIGSGGLISIIIKVFIGVVSYFVSLLLMELIVGRIKKEDRNQILNMLKIWKK